jgi:hypothetical protein
MKPRSTVAALLAITETLIAARANATQAKQGASRPMRESKVARLLGVSRLLMPPRIKPQPVS